MKNVLFALVMIMPFCINAQNASTTKVLLVNPPETDAAAVTMHSPHVALYNTGVPTNHKLFLMIVGTGGAATDMRPVDSLAATFGYHAISLDYKNNVITTVCNNSADSACFDHFRQEIMFGTPVSDSVNVDSANSIINRFQKLLAYLVKADPQGGWDDFYKNGKIKWENIAVGGHSQGAGHSAFIAKHYKLYKALIFSGPQDYRVAFNSPALWLSGKSATPINRYYAFLHINDQYVSARQLANCAVLMHTAVPDSLMVQPGVPLVTSRHILVNSMPNVNAHMSTLLLDFKNVWEYMLKP